MKILFIAFAMLFATTGFARVIECTDYKETTGRTKYSDLKLEIRADKVIVSFNSDTTGKETWVYPKIHEFDFKIAAFLQKTDVVSGAVWTFGVDFYKEKMMVHRYVVQGPGFNLVYGQASQCVEIGEEE